LDEIERLARKSLEEYLESRIDEVLAERYLERMIGRMIDVNYHLITESDLPPPRDYYDSFTDLAKIGVLPRDFAGRLAACAGLRNRIAHEYDEIEPAKVHEALRTAAQEIPEYLRHVDRYLDRFRPPA
ncbi:MAG: DUF86 domain-containing protein, partial [Betaproteobacteria bacterium]|nr:DUF86 domain-containing protein [Betaproteobacteria bacterium]